MEITDYHPKDKPISIVTEHIWIDVPQEKVYAALEDLSKFVLFHPRIQHVQILSAQSKGKGTRSRWTIFSATGDTVQWDEELIEAKPPYFLAFHSPPPPASPRTVGWLQLTSAMGGTHITFQETDYFPVADPDKKRLSMLAELLGLKTYLETGRILKYNYYPPSEETPLLLTTTVDIAVPLEKVWAIVTDIPRFTEIDPGVEKIEMLSPNKSGLGAKSRWTVERPKGNIFQWEEEVTAWNPPYSYGFHIPSEVHEMFGTQTLTPINNGNHTRLSFRSTRLYQVPSDFIDRTLEIMHELINNIKRYAESQVE